VLFPTPEITLFFFLTFFPFQNLSPGPHLAEPNSFLTRAQKCQRLSLSSDGFLFLNPLLRPGFLQPGVLFKNGKRDFVPRWFQFVEVRRFFGLGLSPPDFLHRVGSSNSSPTPLPSIFHRNSVSPPKIFFKPLPSLPKSSL